ncbi:ATP-binding protein [Embleya sp. NPDC020630]|uniref:ATP-binding protein n=1 Tax=Embleya sp. NPDC020630 TaxID=3363979 RepID=UPI003789FC0E
MTEPQPIGRFDKRMADILAARGIDPTAEVHLEPDDPRGEALRLASERIPPLFRDAQPWHPDVLSWVDEVLRNADRGITGMRRITTGSTLLIGGTTGTGKTHNAFGALRRLIASGCATRWTAYNQPDLHAHLRPRKDADNEREFLAIANSPLLILDDLGAAKPSEWTEELIYRLINRRYEHMLPTLITTNLRFDHLGSYLGDRIASRLIEMSTEVHLTGEDLRRAIRAQRELDRAHARDAA